MSTTFRAIGLMSGTSMDGIDVALVETDGESRITMGPGTTVPYTDAERSLLREGLAVAVGLRDRHARPGVLAEAERLITDRHGDAVEAFLVANQVPRDSIDVVGFHGQTVLHRPHERLTVQIGDGGALAKRLGLPVVADLRAADVERGGQGAPLVPVYHQALVEAAGLPQPALVINIGGVSNITFVRPGREPIACDTGPGNALLDDLMLERTGSAVDRDGATAASGVVHHEILVALLNDPFFAKPAPKSLDRNHFSRKKVADLPTQDAAATLTAFTAAGLAAVVNILPEPPAVAVVCGGGAYNPTLMRMLRERFSCPVRTADDLGWRADMIEAQAFAYLAVRSLRRLPLTYPGTTGVPQALTGGVLFEGCPPHSARSDADMRNRNAATDDGDTPIPGSTRASPRNEDG